MSVQSSYNISNNKLKRAAQQEKKLIIYQLNCNGLNSNLSEIKLFLYNRKPDIFCLCETFITRHEPKFTGYIPIWNHRVNKAKGGLAILIREDIRYKISLMQPFGDGYLELQSVKIFSDFGEVDLVNIYNPCKDVSYEEFEAVNFLEFNLRSCVTSFRKIYDSR